MCINVRESVNRKTFDKKIFCGCLIRQVGTINKNVEDVIAQRSNDVSDLLNITQDVLIISKEDIFNKFIKISIKT